MGTHPIFESDFDCLTEMDQMNEPLIYASDPRKENDLESDFNYGNNVMSASADIRKGFLRKVYGILSVQLLMTTGVSAICIASEPTKLFLQNNPFLVQLSSFSCIFVLFALMVKRQQFPVNFYLLGLFTFLEAIAIGSVVTYFAVDMVVRAALISLSVFCLLTSFTLQSKKDYSSWGAGLFSALWILIFASILQVFFPTEIFDFGISIAGALVFSLFIIYDTHMIMRKLSPEEYIFAAINLYLDIINLFLHILKMLSRDRN